MYSAQEELNLLATGSWYNFSLRSSKTELRSHIVTKKYIHYIKVGKCKRLLAIGVGDRTGIWFHGIKNTIVKGDFLDVKEKQSD